MSNSNSTSINFCPCVKCGAIDRYKNGDCKPCASIRGALSYQANRESRLAYTSAYRAANHEKVKAGHVARRKANPEKAQAKDAAYRAKADTIQAKAYQANYYMANRDALLAASAVYKQANPEVGANYREKNKQALHAGLAVWRAANTEKTAASSAAWAKANPQARRINQHNRRARQVQAGGALSPGLSEKLFSLQGGKCPCCRQPLGVDYHLDHIVPLALGGSNTNENMQLLRAKCNLQKHKKDPLEFMQERGFLL